MTRLFRLAATVAVPALYYLLLALKPGWLAGRAGAWPVSVLLALAAFALLLMLALWPAKAAR
ncbi:hypothetical protein [Crenobacter intestini]|uniref:Uncharacterized protein n=1 Tax=Crenobacter intestini TaxID=2563443 RepID=A0A4T0UKI0_9NEIS|nr:hypothetical protein [Crenobacter intestini]TIC78675.1 hypothetical protein E5K04_15390 [Crenobacter intestini]